MKDTTARTAIPVLLAADMTVPARPIGLLTEEEGFVVGIRNSGLAIVPWTVHLVRRDERGHIVDHKGDGIGVFAYTGLGCDKADIEVAIAEAERLNVEPGDVVKAVLEGDVHEHLSYAHSVTLDEDETPRRALTKLHARLGDDDDGRRLPDGAPTALYMVRGYLTNWITEEIDDAEAFDSIERAVEHYFHWSSPMAAAPSVRTPAKAPTYDADTPMNSTTHLDQQVQALFMALFHTHGLTLPQCDRQYLRDTARGDGPGLDEMRKAFSNYPLRTGFSFTFSNINENPEEYYGLPSVAVMREGSDTVLMKVFSVPDDAYPEDPIRHDVFFADISDVEKQELVDALGVYLDYSRLMAEAQLRVLNRLAGRAAAA